MMTEYITLTQLNRIVSETLKSSFEDTYWILAETSDVRINSFSGHCFLELIDKSAETGDISAKARAFIPKTIFSGIRMYFQEATGRDFSSDLKVLVKVSVEFHPVYGYSLTVFDIDPSYTLGEINRKRQKILKQLEAEGVINLNKELELSPFAQRIALISSPTAAGYGDFFNHIRENKFGFVFYIKLFPALMQGEKTSQSICSALDKIFKNKKEFDAVAVIRGGGASSDLSSFDDYMLAAAVAQFPLPVITGIGHQRDDTVLDFVACHSVKTPTAVADLLVGNLYKTYVGIGDWQDKIVKGANDFIHNKKNILDRLSLKLPLSSISLLEKNKSSLASMKIHLHHIVSDLFTLAKSDLKEKESFLNLSSPEYILSKGYAVVRKENKAVRDASSLHSQDPLEITFYKGKAQVRVD